MKLYSTNELDPIEYAVLHPIIQFHVSIPFKKNVTYLKTYMFFY